MSVDSLKPWFASYIDATAAPLFAFEQPDVVEANKNVVLSFIVSSKNDACTPSWGGVYTLDDAGVKLDLDRRIARYRQQGGHIAISFGGALNDELSVNCQDSTKLKAAYRAVIDRYNLDTIDLDIEGDDLKNHETMERRSSVIASLQNERKKKR